MGAVDGVGGWDSAEVVGPGRLLIRRDTYMTVLVTYTIETRLAQNPQHAVPYPLEADA